MKTFLGEKRGKRDRCGSCSLGVLDLHNKTNGQADEKTLIDLDKGEEGEITSIRCSGQTRGRLVSFGMIPGRIVTCVDKIPRGPVILRFHELKIAIGRKTASMCDCKPCKGRGDNLEPRISYQETKEG